MPFEKFEDMESVTEERRKAIAKSIRTVDVEELKKLGNEIFHDVDEPWRVTFFGLIDQNPGGPFHEAVTDDGIIFVYYRDADKGLWYVRGSGKGPLGPKGRQMMKEAIDGRIEARS